MSDAHGWVNTHGGYWQVAHGGCLECGKVLDAGPPPRGLPRDDLVDACRRYLSGKHCTLWGSMFTIKGGQDEKDRAAEWLADQVESVLASMEGMTWR